MAYLYRYADISNSYVCVCDISSRATYTGFSLLSKNGEKEEVYSHKNDNQPSYVTKETFNILIYLLLPYT